MFYAPGKFHRAGGTHWFEGLGDVIRLTIGFGDNPRIQPLKDGTVKPDSIKLEFQASRNLFYHNLAIDDLDGFRDVHLGNHPRKGTDRRHIVYKPSMPGFPSVMICTNVC